MSDRPSRTPLFLAILFAITSVAALAAPQTAAAWSSGTFNSASERQLISLTNRSRASAGLRALRVDSTLTSVARWRSKDMIDRDYFSHTIPGYGSVFKRLDSKGYCYKVAGENIGWNTNPDDEATSVIHRMFMDSADHRANILGRAWDVIGVGAYKGSDGKKMWTVLFADKCGSTAQATTASRATSKATARPKPKPVATPRPKATPSPTPTPAPAPTPLATAPIAGLDTGAHATSAEPTPTADPGDSPEAASLRVVESPPAGGLVDAIVGGIAGSFFGT